MIKGADDTRFGKKLESVFWWIIRLFPLILFCFFVWGFFRTPIYSDLVIADGDSLFSSVGTVGLLLDAFFDEYLAIPDSFVYESLYAAFGPIGVVEIAPAWLFFYASYLVAVECIRFFINFLLYIVRLVNNLLERCFK